jgi:F0F1-type ATP synthase delta subunit
MNNTELYQEFIEGILTQEQLNARIEDIEGTSAWIYKGGKVPLSEKIKSSVSESFRSLVAGLEKKEQLPNVRKDVSDFFKGLIRTLEEIPVVRLTLAFLPSDEFLTKLAAWLRKQTGKRVVVDIIVDEQIIAGCKFEYKGEYRDFSFASKLNEVIEQGALKAI